MKFSIPATQFVSLKVYDLLGNELSTLVNDVMSRGDHEVKFNAEGLENGTYFCKFQAGGFTEVIRMVIIN